MQSFNKMTAYCKKNLLIVSKLIIKFKYQFLVKTFKFNGFSVKKALNFLYFKLFLTKISNYFEKKFIEKYHCLFFFLR